MSTLNDAFANAAKIAEKYLKGVKAVEAAAKSATGAVQTFAYSIQQNPLQSMPSSVLTNGTDPALKSMPTSNLGSYGGGPSDSPVIGNINGK
jgi:hypothetical protein